MLMLIIIIGCFVALLVVTVLAYERELNDKDDLILQLMSNLERATTPALLVSALEAAVAGPMEFDDLSHLEFTPDFTPVRPWQAPNVHPTRFPMPFNVVDAWTGKPVTDFTD